MLTEKYCVDLLTDQFTTCVVESVKKSIQLQMREGYGHSLTNLRTVYVWSSVCGCLLTSTDELTRLVNRAVSVSDFLSGKLCSSFLCEKKKKTV